MGMDDVKADGDVKAEAPRFTRRAFLQGLGLAGGTLALLALYGPSAFLGARELTHGGRSVSRTTGAPRYAVPSTCRMCPARCGIICFIEDGRLVKIEGNPKDLNSRGRICAKGLAGIQYAYHPDRLVKPLMRVGPRGAGQWQTIPWEEAFGELAARLDEARGRPERLIVLSGEPGGVPPVLRRFAWALGTPLLVDLAEGSLDQLNERTAWEATWGTPGVVPDLARSKYILVLAANPYEGGPHFLPLVQRLVEGRMKGAKLVTFDARLTNTAGRSDEWFPLKPGSETVVLLTLANHILQLGLYDRAFIGRWVDLPLEDLAFNLSPYTPELASALSGIPAAHLRRIAVEYATTRPAAVIVSGGRSLHSPGVQVQRAAALLCALTGNIEVPGGVFPPRFYPQLEPDPAPPPPQRTVPLFPQEMAQRVLPDLAAGSLQADVLITYRANPAFSHPEAPKLEELLGDEQRLPYHVVLDSFLTETALWADLVLPVATYLEGWGLHSPLSFEGVPQLNLQQPVITPLTPPLEEVCAELAGRLRDVERFFRFGSMEDYLEATTSRLEGLERVGGLDYLKANGTWRDPAEHPRIRRYREEGFPTPSGKLQFHAPALAVLGLPERPTHVTPPAYQELDEDQFILVTFETNVQDGSLTADLMWLAEIDHDTPLWINKASARRLGIRSDDPVELRSSQGVLRARARLTQGLHPQVAALRAGGGHWANGRVSQAKAFKSADPNTHLIWWERNGVHAQRIVPLGTDPLSGRPAWLAPVVHLRRAPAEGGE